MTSDNIQDFLLRAKEILPVIGIGLFLCGTIDNYFLTRYGGKLNRGFTIWSQPLKEDQRRFLANLNDDIVDKRQVGILIKITRTSFISVKDREALIRYNNTGQGTSWPMVGYVDLSSPNPVLEYRSSLLMLIATLLISLIQIIVFVVLAIGFLIGWLSETGGIKNYLSQKTDLYFVRQLTQTPKGFS